MKYQYKYDSAFYDAEEEIFDTEEEYRIRFRDAHSMFGMFIDNEEIDMLKVVCGPESYTLRRVYESEFTE